MSSMGTFICVRKSRKHQLARPVYFFYAGNSFQRPFTALFDAPVNESPPVKGAVNLIVVWVFEHIGIDAVLFAGS
jgi:hypothetical protein